MMRRLLALVLIVPATAAAAPGIRGFFETSLAAEQRREAQFQSSTDPARIRETMKLLSARPHHVGSPYGKENAEWMLAKFQEWGFDAKIETFDVLFPTPKERLLEMLEPEVFRARLEEPAVPEDPTSGQKDEQLPSYNAYSSDGDVTAPLVYVNYGTPADYEELSRLGISVEGKIVIARYGESWRGIKPKLAAEHGAIGCLIYSDPRDDGYFQGETFPMGAYRPKDGVQRGSVADMPLYPGDPGTPGYGSVPGARRLSLSEMKTLTKIPVLPISYADAEPLLRHLQGPVAPAAWRGALPITYRVGPGASRVHLRLRFNWDVKPIRDVIATLRGSEFPDQWVIRGNHHDAWVNGASDPVSGLSALLEEARVLGELSKQGWKPKRTIVYCAWDGEEPGLLGSTEWAETHAEELESKAVAYVNTDNNVRGYLHPSASHTLQLFLHAVADSVEDPETHLSLARRLQLRDIRSAGPGSDSSGRPDAAKVRARRDTPVKPLGSGSDYTAFLDHLGVASIDLRFEDEDESGGVYHSIYDDFFWYSRFTDREFAYEKALADTAGLAVLRLCDADLLPFDFIDSVEAISEYSKELKTNLSRKRSETAEKNRQIDEGVFTATNDPERRLALPAKEDLAPELDWAAFDRAGRRLAKSALSFDAAFRKTIASGLRQDRLAPTNDRIFQVERAFLSDEGLPGRPWFKHQIYAPGFYTGYGVKTLPAIREAIEQKDWKLAQQEIGVVSRILENASAAIEGAKKALRE
jgi:N-acetylated-alpha-linked acidic dipeptidase